MEVYDNIKTSLTAYELWNFLSRIIPKSNGAEAIAFKETKISVVFSDAEFLSHLSLQNTLEQLKAEGLVKDYSAAAIK
jgi:hypothetical protein